MTGFAVQSSADVYIECILTVLLCFHTSVRKSSGFREAPKSLPRPVILFLLTTKHSLAIYAPVVAYTQQKHQRHAKLMKIVTLEENRLKKT